VTKFDVRNFLLALSGYKLFECPLYRIIIVNGMLGI